MLAPSLGKAALLVALPVAEFLGFRLLLRNVLQLHIGYRAMTDYDFVFPSFIAFFLLISLMESTRPLRLGLNRAGALINLALALLFFLLCNSYRDVQATLPHASPLIFATLAVLMVFSALFVLLHPREVVSHPKRFLVIPALLTGASIILSKNLAAGLWYPASHLTAKLACGIVQFTPGVECSFDAMVNNEGPYQIIAHKLHTVLVGTGCGGMEGVSFFLFAAALILIALHERFDLLKAALFLGLGATGIFLVNVLRIAIYYRVVLWMGETLGNAVGFATVRTLFHNSLGWMLYAAYLWLYLRYWSKVLQDVPPWERRPPAVPAHAM